MSRLLFGLNLAWARLDHAQDGRIELATGFHELPNNYLELKSYILCDGLGRAKFRCRVTVWCRFWRF